MDKAEEAQLFEALCVHGGMFALQQVELLKRLHREPNHHKELTHPKRY